MECPRATSLPTLVDGVALMRASTVGGGSSWDAVVIGAGHNGLVAAFTLARAGLRTLVLERRSIVGGACVTEEFAPGYFASSGAYVLSMLRPDVWRECRLVERGLRVDSAGPTCNLGTDGTALWLYDDPRQAVREVARLSPNDARNLPRFQDDLARLGRMVTPLIDQPPPDLTLGTWRELGGAARLARRMLAGRRDVPDLLHLLTASVQQVLDERFESPALKAALGWHAVNDSTQGPSSPGTGYVLLHDHAAAEAGGGVRQWGFVRGGMGRVTALLAEAAREAGAEIRTEAQVVRIVVAKGRVVGIELDDGSTISAHLAVSNADPPHTFLTLLGPEDLPPSFVGAIRAYRCEGTSIKINCALGALPQVVGFEGQGVQPIHRGVVEVLPSLETLDWHQALARRGEPASGTHIEFCFPTVHDPSLAPPGRHIVTIDVTAQPYRLGEGTWDGIKERVADRVIHEMAAWMPELTSAIVAREVLSPVDLERRIGITGGHALHWEMTLDQLFFLRPVAGWANYRTPIDGLYLCGAGTHPGGGVTGANGRNAARQVLRDRRRQRHRTRRRERYEVVPPR